MASFTIHLAVGEQYINKHKNEIKNTEQFMKGIIAPDLNAEMTEIEKDKSKSHYGTWGNYILFSNIDEFLADKKVDVKNDYWKGYFLHLLTDYYFYQIDFYEETQQTKKEQTKFYHDYDCLNKELKNKYSIDKYITKSIRKYMNILDEEPKYLKTEKIIDFIEKVSNFDIETEVKIIEEKGMEGLK